MCNKNKKQTVLECDLDPVWPKRVNTYSYTPLVSRVSSHVSPSIEIGWLAKLYGCQRPTTQTVHGHCEWGTLAMRVIELTLGLNFSPLYGRWCCLGMFLSLNSSCLAGGLWIIMTWRTCTWTGWFTGCATNVYHWANCDSDSCMLWMHVFMSSWCTPHPISRTCKITVWCKSYHVCNLRGRLWAVVDFSKPSDDVCVPLFEMSQHSDVDAMSVEADCGDDRSLLSILEPCLSE